jgi:hypothetical protein
VNFLVKLAEVEEADARAEANLEHGLPARELLQTQLDAVLVHAPDDGQAVKLDWVFFIHANVTLEWQELQANLLLRWFHVGLASNKLNDFSGFHFTLST